MRKLTLMVFGILAFGSCMVACTQSDEAATQGSAEVSKELEGQTPPEADARAAEKGAATGMDPNDPSQRGRR